MEKRIEMKLLDTTPEISSEALDKIGKDCEALHILFTAFDFDLFSLLEEPKTAKQISEEIETQLHLTEKLLNALVALQLLSKHDGRYTNTKLASTFIVRSSPFYQGNLLRLHAKGTDNWSKLFDLKLSLQGDRHYIYTETEYIELLEEVGFSSIRVLDISSSSSPSAIIIGRKEV